MNLFSVFLLCSRPEQPMNWEFCSACGAALHVCRGHLLSLYTFMCINNLDSPNWITKISPYRYKMGKKHREVDPEWINSQTQIRYNRLPTSISENQTLLLEKYSVPAEELNSSCRRYIATRVYSNIFARLALVVYLSHLSDSSEERKNTKTTAACLLPAFGTNRLGENI